MRPCRQTQSPVQAADLPMVCKGWVTDIADAQCDAYAPRMNRTQQTFGNKKDAPIYISIEPWPDCFELEPGDRLTLIYDAAETGDALSVDFINERELVVWPNGAIDSLQVLFNDGPSDGRSWNFKHKTPATSD